MKNLRLKDVPQKHWTKMFANLVKFRGVENSRELLTDNITLLAAFPWILTDEGNDFWRDINESAKKVKKKKQQVKEKEVIKSVEFAGCDGSAIHEVLSEIFKFRN